MWAVLCAAVIESPPLLEDERRLVAVKIGAIFFFSCNCRGRLFQAIIKLVASSNLRVFRIFQSARLKLQCLALKICPKSF